MFHVKPGLADLLPTVLAALRGEAALDTALSAVVAYQRARIPALAAYWASRGFVGEPDDPARIPAVPTDVFRHVSLTSDEAPPAIVFRTSGTTSGARGQSPRLSTAAYDLGARLHFGAMVPSPEPTAFPSLVFDPLEVPDSSLSYMVAVLAAGRAAPVSYHLRENGIDVPAFEAAILRATGPVVVFGTAFAFLHLVDERHEPLPLPPGSTIFETGGFKGRTRELSRTELVGALSDLFRVPDHAVRSEYSMTELSSQLYSLPCAADEAPLYVPPRWCHVSAVDPDDLAPLPPEKTGLLRFVDLANVDTPVAVQTSDLGTVDAAGRVRLLGRAAGATPRGCSLAAEEVFEVARRRRGASA